MTKFFICYHLNLKQQTGYIRTDQTLSSRCVYRKQTSRVVKPQNLVKSLNSRGAKKSV